MNHRILVIDGNPEAPDSLALQFARAGFECVRRLPGSVSQGWLEATAFDLVVLSIDQSHHSVGTAIVDQCVQIRNASPAGVLVYSAIRDDALCLQLLNAGADDVIAPPCSSDEVLARARAVLRRVVQPMFAQLSGPVTVATSIPAPELASNAKQHQAARHLVLDSHHFTVSHNGIGVALTSVEFHLFRQLFELAGSIVSRENLLRSMYRDNRVVSLRTIDTHIKNIRKKLKAALPDMELIQSVYGVGYKLEVVIAEVSLCS